MFNHHRKRKADEPITTAGSDEDSVESLSSDDEAMQIEIEANNRNMRFRSLKSHFEELIDKVIDIHFILVETDGTMGYSVLGLTAKNELKEAMGELDNNDDPAQLRDFIARLTSSLERLKKEKDSFNLKVEKLKSLALTSDRIRALKPESIVEKQEKSIAELELITSSLALDLDSYVEEILSTSVNRMKM